MLRIINTLLFPSIFLLTWGAMSWHPCGEEIDERIVVAERIEKRIFALLGVAQDQPIGKVVLDEKEDGGNPPPIRSPRLLPALCEHEEVLRLLGFLREGGRLPLPRYPKLVEPGGRSFSTGFCGIGGFYDPGTKRLVLRGRCDDFDFYCAVVHGVVHALQDRRLDLAKRLKSVEDDDDRRLAWLALIEGEAQLVLDRFTRRYASEMASILQEGGADPSSLEPVASRLAARNWPQVLIDSLSFPYGPGERFVTAVFRRKGYDGIEGLFTAPPESSEQILHPEKVLNEVDPPKTVALADLAAITPDYEKTFENTLGEWGISCLVRETGDAIRALRVGSGWGGDRYAVYQSRGDGGMGLYLATVWDHGKDAWQFFDAMAKGLAFKLDASISNASAKPDTPIWIEGKKGLALIEQREDRVLILEGFSQNRPLLEALAKKAWGFEVR